MEPPRGIVEVDGLEEFRVVGGEHAHGFFETGEAGLEGVVGGEVGLTREERSDDELEKRYIIHHSKRSLRSRYPTPTLTF